MSSHAGGRRGRPLSKKERARLRIVVFGFLGIMTLCAILLSQCAKQVDPLHTEMIMGIPVTEELLQEGTLGRPGIKRDIKWIVIHETGNPAAGSTAAAHSDYIQKSSRTKELSWHYTVDDTEIYHHLPDNEVGWHAGDKMTPGGGNMAGIGIEICVNEDGNYEKSFDNAAKLTAYLLDYYGLSVSAIKQHGDFMDKNCPQNMRDSGRWDEFIDITGRYLKEIRSGNVS